MTVLAERTRFPRARYWEAKDQALAPTSYRNWIAYIEQRRDHGSSEYALVTDTHIIGEIQNGLGPYRILHPLMFSMGAGTTQIRLVLRVDRHLYPSPLFGTGAHTHRVPYEYCDCAVLYGNKPSQKKRRKRYSKSDVIENVDHGGIVKEIAALLSLCLGAVINDGGEIRQFYPKGHPEGHPCSFDIQNIPNRPLRGNRRMIPYDTAPPKIDQYTHLLSAYPLLSPIEAAALIRASRLYKDALWHSDAMPELSWLMLVQAVETAAKQCTLNSTEDNTVWNDGWGKNLHEYLLELKLLQPQIDRIGEIIPRNAGIRRKFVSFISNRLAPEPPARPNANFQMSWGWENWNRVLSNIYDLRSEALHEGRPFPPELCSLPDLSDDGIYAEYPPPYATDTRCVHLHIFAYVVRLALLKWWEDMWKQETANN